MRGAAFALGPALLAACAAGDQPVLRPLPRPAMPSALFGASLAAAGAWLAVGAPGDDGAGVEDGGRVYMLRLAGGRVVEDGPLPAPGRQARDQLGYAVAVSGDRVAVGAIGEGDGAGAVHLFRREAGAWIADAHLVAPRPQAGAFFGASVALAGDLLVVGAPYEDGVAAAPGPAAATIPIEDAGRVYLFRREGRAWRPDAQLVASNAGDGDVFGYAVAFDGETLAVGAPGEASAAPGVNAYRGDRSAPYAGAVYVYARAGAAWTERAYLKASRAGGLSYFGSSVALAAERLVVGAPGEGPASAGAAYLFDVAPTAERRRLQPPAAHDYAAFGTAVAASAAAIAITDGGSARALHLWSPDGARLAGSFVPDDTAPATGFGCSVAVDGPRVLVGASGEGRLYQGAVR